MNSQEKPYIITLESFGGVQRGALTVAESDKDIPFPIERIYWINGCPEGSVRGRHANKANQQVVVALSGSAVAELTDKQGVTYTFELSSPFAGTL